MRPPAPGTRLVATVIAEGFASEERVALRAEGTVPDGWATTITLQPAGALRARIEPPADGEYDARIEHRKAEVWVPVLRVPRDLSRTGAPFQADGLRAGTYRLRDALSGAVSSTLPLVLGAQPPTLALDLSEAGPCAGTLIVPEGVDPEEVRLEVTGVGIAFDDVLRSAGDGPPRWLRGTSWSVRHPGRAAITVAALHPRCETADGEGRLVLERPAQGLVLRLRAKR